MILLSQEQVVYGQDKTASYTSHVAAGDAPAHSETFTVNLPVRKILDELWVDPVLVKTTEFKQPLPDRDSFTELKKSGAVKFTDYQNGWERIEKHFVQIPETSYALLRAHGTMLKTTDGVTRISDMDWAQQVHSNTYHTMVHIDYVHRLFDVVDLRLSLDEKIEKAINDTMSSVVSELNSTYDLLTEMAEFKSTLEFLSSVLMKVRHPLQAFIAAKKKLEKSKLPEKEIHDAITSLWMQYRYALMPLVYSTVDILKTIEAQYAAYRTARSRKVLTHEKVDLPEDKCVLWEELMGTITIRSTGKHKCSLNGTLRLIDLVKTNPISTAWELIPYSFVIDWFINIGDYLDAQLGGLFSFSNEKHFVYSIKSHYTLNTYLDFYKDERGSAPDNSVFYYWSQGVRIPYSTPWTEVHWGNIVRGRYLLQAKTCYSYIRRKFNPSDVKLQFEFDMNWKRWLDAYVLSLGQSRAQLKKLKL